MIARCLRRGLHALLLLAFLIACDGNASQGPTPPVAPPPTVPPASMLPPGTTVWQFMAEKDADGVLRLHHTRAAFGGQFQMTADGQVITTTVPGTFYWWDDPLLVGDEKSGTFCEPVTGDVVPLTVGVGGAFQTVDGDPLDPTLWLLLYFWNSSAPPFMPGGISDFPAQKYQTTCRNWDENGEYIDQDRRLLGVDYLTAASARLEHGTAEFVFDFDFGLGGHYHIVSRIICTAGCQCNSDKECDDGQVCTRDACVARQCVHTPDDTIIPPQVAGDCRRCQSGQVYSVRQAVESECDRIRRQTVSTCAVGNRNWIVHWAEEFSGSQSASHYCQYGEVPATSNSAICDGAGQCPAGQPSTFLEGSISQACQSPGGQSVELTCNVFCTRCR